MVAHQDSSTLLFHGILSRTAIILVDTERDNEEKGTFPGWMVRTPHLAAPPAIAVLTHAAYSCDSCKRLHLSVCCQNLGITPCLYERSPNEAAPEYGHLIKARSGSPPTSGLSVGLVYWTVPPWTV